MAAPDTRPTIAIVADDLTGALDAAAPLRRQGFDAAVALTPAALATITDVPVVAVTTESRHLANPLLALAAAVATLPPVDLVYKKIDSTLRGPIAAELGALLALTGRRAALVTPTLPHQRRALIEGTLIVDGVPTATHLPTLLASTGLPVVAVPLAVVRDPAAFGRTLREATRSTALVALDAVTDDDLRCIAAAAATLPEPVLLAGSAGLAAWLPLAGTPILASSSVAHIQPRGPVLFAFGSAHTRTHEQLDNLRDDGVVSIVLDPADPNTATAACAAALAAGDDVLLAVAPPEAPIASIPPAIQQSIARVLARVVGVVLERATVGALVMGGGDTAYAVCDHLGIQRLTLADEVLPGLPLSHGTTSAGSIVWCVTKAGGFGAPDALRHVRALLHGANHR